VVLRLRASLRAALAGTVEPAEGCHLAVLSSYIALSSPPAQV